MKIENIEHAQQISRAQERRELKNCALLCAYAYGSAPGWYAISAGHIDGFAADYAMIRCAAEDFENHPVLAFYTLGNEGVTSIGELDEIRATVKKSQEMDELPPVTTLTEEEKAAALAVVREAWGNYASGKIDGILVRSDEAGVEALESGTLNGGERIAKGDMLDDVADRLKLLTSRDAEAWLEKLCDDVTSDVIGTDWAAVAAAVTA